MATEVLLMQSVPGLGEQGDICKVAPGYARNYLLPRGIAEPVTVAARRRLDKMVREQETERKATLAEAKRKAATLKDASVTISARTTDGETLYGSVTAADIAEQIAALGIEIDRAAVQLGQPIKALGSYDVTLKIHPDVSTTVKVWVIE